jgi:hypothetical protein
MPKERRTTKMMSSHALYLEALPDTNLETQIWILHQPTWEYRSFGSLSYKTEITLSTCKAEYMCLSQALRKTIPLMNLVDKMTKKGFIKEQSQLTVRCKLFEDNSAALTLANSPAMKP